MNKVLKLQLLNRREDPSSHYAAVAASLPRKSPSGIATGTATPSLSTPPTPFTSIEVEEKFRDI